VTCTGRTGPRSPSPAARWTTPARARPPTPDRAPPPTRCSCRSGMAGCCSAGPRRPSAAPATWKARWARRPGCATCCSNRCNRPARPRPPTTPSCACSATGWPNSAARRCSATASACTRPCRANRTPSSPSARWWRRWSRSTPTPCSAWTPCRCGPRRPRTPAGRP
jgi:hypothetical protein